MFDVITIGAATRDVFLISPDFQLINDSKLAIDRDRCVTLGSKLDVADIVFATGGGATNAAATFAKLGFKTGIIARLGHDDAGRAVMADLDHYQVHTELIRIVPKEHTAYSTLLTNKNGERSILVYRGASSSFSTIDIPWKKLGCKWLYITSLGGNLELLKKIIRVANKQGVQIALNPGQAELKRVNELQGLLPSLSVLIVNLAEAQQLTGTQGPDGAKLARLLARPNLTVIVTNGARGAYAHTDGQTWFARTNGQKSVSSTGAGDAFGAGVVAGLAKGHELDNALRLGMLNATGVIQKFGAKAGILSRWPKQTQLNSISVKTQ